MRRSFLIVSLTFFLTSLTMPLPAQTQNKAFKPTCEVQTPKEVQKGELFTYTIITNAKADINDLDFGPFLINGQASNASSAIKVENGKKYSKTRREYIYYLSADSLGTFTIPANEIKVNGKKMTLKAVQVDVIPSDKPHNDLLTIFYADTFYDDGDLSTYDVVEDVVLEPMPVHKVRDPYRTRRVLLYVLLGAFALFVIVMLVASYLPGWLDRKKSTSQDPENDKTRDDEELKSISE
ncbi:MAG: BatD family protein [Bacteroidales bacterium]|nr:BatD family protein [Bacteroidales bacterium]